jgi:hypothetical protein
VDHPSIVGGAAQLVNQAVVIEPYSRVCFPCVLDDGGGPAKALGNFDVRISQLNTRVPEASGVGQ